MRTTAIALAAGVLAGCGGDSAPPAAPTVPVAQATTTRLVIDGADSVVELQAVQLAVTAHRSDGSAPTVTGQATWTTSAPRVATVAAGLVTGENHGTVTITAEYDGQSQDHEVTVTRRPPMQCFVNPATDTPWGIEKSVGPADFLDVEVTYRLLNDCASRVRASRFRVQIWANPERTGQRISPGGQQDIGDVVFPEEAWETVRIAVALEDGYTWEDVTPEAVRMSWETSYAE